jgi:hypothetical protein
MFLAAIALIGGAAAALADDPLAAGFENPPLSARPQTWWHWMNGNITRQGITADLEAMHRIGISEANIITGAIDIPPGPVPVMSPQFFDMVEYAAKQADRLGMTLCMDNCPGWSSSGGPWITPEHAMLFVTASETGVQGPAPFSGKLPQPPTKRDFYHDIAVLAFKTPAGEDEAETADNPPSISTSVSGVDASSLLVRGSTTLVKFPIPDAGDTYFVQIEFPKPVTAHTVIVSSGTMRMAGGEIQASDDGRNFRDLIPFTIPRNATTPVGISLGEQAVTARAFRLEFDHAAAGSTGVTLKGVEFSRRVMIQNLGPKASYEPDEVPPAEMARDEKIQVPPEFIVHRDEIIDLTSSLAPDGSLTWSVPPGHWTILRIGYTPTGITNHPAPPEATGLECDKLSPDGLDASWKGMMEPILNRLGPLAGRILDASLIDSYETGGQNWTPRMVEYFKQLRGYDPTPYLPVMTGRIVDSPQVSERFLWDLRRTVADLFASNYYGHFTELCHSRGLKSMVEPYTGPFESLQAGAAVDIPMGEFWAGGNGHASLKMASSVGHIYGQTVIGAESFTGRPEHGSWMEDPYSFKALGDLAFCAGINRFIFHRFTHQPWLDKYPGMTMGQWGINFDRTNTWFELAKPWMDYLARSQFLLQQGRSVADVAYFCGQSAPVLSRIGNPPLPKGFDFDEINADVLLNRARVADHRLVLPTGASYAVLVLPAADPDMTPALAHKIRDLVNDGLTVIGPRPDQSPSLQDYPDCDAEVQKTSAELWGDCDGNNVTEHDLGSGRIFWGQSLEQVLSSLGIAPDFHAAGAGSPLIYIHRTLADADVYFVANHSAGELHEDCTFRISGKVPELWHPDSGVMETAAAYQVSGGRTTVPLDFDPSGSVFVVFRQADAAGDHAVSAPRRLVEAAPIAVTGPWTLNFPPNWGAPASVTLDHLISWPQSADNGIRYFSGTAAYEKQLEIPADALGDGQLLQLDLGGVKNLAQVRLNGTDLGILWKPPFCVQIASAAKAGANDLEIRVTNLWPNRLIGDAQLPEDVEWIGMKLARWPQWLLDGKPSPTGRLTFTTWRHITRDMPLLPSGLLGPVVLRPEKWVASGAAP